MPALRYLLYLAFVAAAVVFWLLFFVLILGFLPVPAEPECALEPGGCPAPGLLEQVLRIICLFGAIPLTAFIFVYYRRWVRRLVGKADD